MFVGGKRKLAMMGSSDQSQWKPPELPSARAPAQIRWRMSESGQKLRRVPERALPSAAVKERMPASQYGPCCTGANGRGQKKWGDGGGSYAFGGNKTFVCHMCLYELEKPGWLILGFNNEQEAVAALKLGAPQPLPRRGRAPGWSRVFTNGHLKLSALIN